MWAARSRRTHQRNGLAHVPGRDVLRTDGTRKLFRQLVVRFSATAFRLRLSGVCLGGRLGVEVCAGLQHRMHDHRQLPGQGDRRTLETEPFPQRQLRRSLSPRTRVSIAMAASKSRERSRPAVRCVPHNRPRPTGSAAASSRRRHRVISGRLPAFRSRRTGRRRRRGSSSADGRRRSRAPCSGAADRGRRHALARASSSGSTMAATAASSSSSRRTRTPCRRRPGRRSSSGRGSGWTGRSRCPAAVSARRAATARAWLRGS
jgi:hypothetical protein